MTEANQMNRRAFAAAAVGTAAVATAVGVPAAAQPTRSMSALTSGDWMAQVKAQHQEIDRHFSMLKATGERDLAQRDAHLKALAMVLTGHSIAEEVALYPGVAITGDAQGSDRLYMEQSHAKVMLAELDAMPKRGREFLPRLTALETAIKAHVAEEEGDLYPKLMRQASPAMNQKMTTDFRREFLQYTT